MTGSVPFDPEKTAAFVLYAKAAAFCHWMRWRDPIVFWYFVIYK